MSKNSHTKQVPARKYSGQIDVYLALMHCSMKVNLKRIYNKCELKHKVFIMKFTQVEMWYLQV